MGECTVCMKKINDNFCGYIKVDNDIYTYSVSTNIVTLLPAQSDRRNRHDAIEHIRSRNADLPEYLFGEDENGMIAMLRNGKFVTSFLGINTTAKFSTPIIVKAYGNAQGFFDMMTEEWNKFHAITFYGGNVNALYNLDWAIEASEVNECLKNDGAREIKIRPWKDYSRSIDLKINNENVTLTFSIGQTAITNHEEEKGSYNLGKLDAFIRFSFERAQDFVMIEKYYGLARKIVAILTAQNNIRFEEVYVSQRNNEQQFFKTGVCKIFDHYENSSKKKWHSVIPIFAIWDYMPNIVSGLLDGKADALLELLPEDNKMVNRISIRNVQDMCTALEVSYHLDDDRKREKDVLIEELKKNIKKTIAEFVKAHNEIDVYKETTISSAFQYLDYTLKQKILTLYNENCKVVNEVVLKNFLPQVNEESIGRFVKLRNSKTHSGTVEWGENAKIYKALMAIVYSNLFRYIGMPDDVIQSVLSDLF